MVDTVTRLIDRQGKGQIQPATLLNAWIKVSMRTRGGISSVVENSTARPGSRNSEKSLSIPGASVSSSLRTPSSNASSPRMRLAYLHTRTHTHAPAPRTNDWLEDEVDEDTVNAGRVMMPSVLTPTSPSASPSASEHKTPDSLAPTKKETATTTTGIALPQCVRSVYGIAGQTATSFDNDDRGEGRNYMYELAGYNCLPARGARRRRKSSRAMKETVSDDRLSAAMSEGVIDRSSEAMPVFRLTTVVWDPNSNPTPKAKSNVNLS
ncbi:hypothetical protein F4604DRAFT_1686203 [Suillus subluteus]|nr:hypothetical protein F4604DRAFT_1686203 [Suillus subluteus]